MIPAGPSGTLEAWKAKMTGTPQTTATSGREGESLLGGGFLEDP
jgi:hypothetical protein